MQIEFNIKSIYSLIIIILFSFIFYESQNVGQKIFNLTILGTSDLSRYYSQYYDPSSVMIKNIDFGYLALTQFLYYIGVSFEIFIYFIILSYFIIFNVLFEKIAQSKDLFLKVILFGMLVFWLEMLTTVAIRQGLAFLFLLSVFSTKEEDNLKRILLYLLSFSMHSSVIVFLPIIFFFKFLKRILFALEIIFIFITIFYCLNLFQLFSSLVIDSIGYFDINIRSLSVSNSTYQTGFNLNKLLPILLSFSLIKFFRFRDIFFSRVYLEIYLIFLASSSLGMILSGLPYHDRIMLYAWACTPIIGSLVFLLLFTKKIKIKKM